LRAPTKPPTSDPQSVKNRSLNDANASHKASQPALCNGPRYQSDKANQWRATTLDLRICVDWHIELAGASSFCRK